VTPQGGFVDPALAHWGLREAPFLLDPDPRFVYEREDHREGLARVLFGVTQMGGIVLVTGEIGCGKTMLAATVTRMLDGHGFRVARVSNPPRTGAALLAGLLEALGAEDTGRTAARRAAAIRRAMRAASERGDRVVLAVDEAQRLDKRALDEVRMLTNPEDGPGCPIVLLGQPELDERVRALPQVDQRVAVRYHLGGMSAQEVEAYIRHRTRAAGATEPVFSERAAVVVHEETEGIPRLVNLTCANALFVAAGRDERLVSEDTVRDVAEDRRRSGLGGEA
jgi:general secretion pathway protein A